MEQIEKRHSAVLTEVFASQEAFNKHEQECSMYETEWNAIVGELLAHDLPVRGFGFSSFAPKTQIFTLDPLRVEDWPYGIGENSVYVMFKVNMDEKYFESVRCGCIHLTEADKKKSYLCMTSISRAHKAIGKKWLRKTKFKNASNLANKVATFWESVMKTLNEVTEGYPYKQMKVNVY